MNPASRSKNGIKKREKPTPDQIYNLLRDGWRVFILKTALKLDIFTVIAEGLHSVKAIATAKNWAMRPTRILLDSLCPFGFLTKKSGDYFLTPLSEAFLVSSSETYGGKIILSLLATETWEQLAEVVMTGKQQILDANKAEFADAWSQDASMESMRTSRIAESLEIWRTVGIDLDKKQDIRILDLASGCGIKSFALAQRNPDVKVTCIDWTGVLKVAERLATKWGILPQVSLRPGNLTTMDYGEAEFDAVLLGQITYYLSIDQNKTILRKVYRALKPRGVVVIHVPIADEERSRSDSLLCGVVVLLFSQDGDIYTFSEYETILKEAGFSKITKHNESLISARK